MQKLNDPIISVIMAIYNEPEEWLRESIESILHQTFSELEFLIINDNPRRKLNQLLLAEYLQKDERIVVVENDENIGLTQSLNKGLALARGEFIARMDGDDISLPKRFEKQISLMRSKPEVIVCGTQVEYFGVTTSRSSDWVHEFHEDIIAQLILSTCMVHPSTMIRKKILEDHKIKYDESFKQAQDLKLWMDLKDLGHFHNLQTVLFKYRISKKQISALNSKKQNNYARDLRRELIVHSIKSLTNESILIPEEITLDFLKVIKKMNKEFNRTQPGNRNRITDNIFTNIIVAIYLSIKTKNFVVLLYYLTSSDLLRTLGNLNNVFRIIEKRVYPNKKPERI